MALYRIATYEVGEKIPTSDGLTRFADPVRLARRYLRFVNHAWNKPGGYDKVVSKADVSQVGIWPDGESFLKTVRAPKPCRC
jgi:hypothetical protein